MSDFYYVPPVTDLDRFMFQIEGMIDLDDEEIRMCKRLFSLRISPPTVHSCIEAVRQRREFLESFERAYAGEDAA
jgi:hypothetical protein